MAVDPRWRRRGIGHALTHARIKWLQERHVDRIYYVTHRQNRASKKLHERFGFVVVPGQWIPPGGTLDDAREQQLYVGRLLATLALVSVPQQVIGQDVPGDPGVPPSDGG